MSLRDLSQVNPIPSDPPQLNTAILDLLQQLHDILREASADKIVVSSMFASYIDDLLPKLTEVSTIAQDLLKKIDGEYLQLSQEHEYLHAVLQFRDENFDNSDVLEAFEMLMMKQGEPFSKEEQLTLYLRELQVCGTLLNVLIRYIQQFTRPILLLKRLLCINTSFTSSTRNLGDYLNQYLQNITKSSQAINSTSSSATYSLYEPCAELIGFICFLLYRCYDDKVMLIKNLSEEGEHATKVGYDLEMLDNTLIFDSEFHYQQEVLEEEEKNELQQKFSENCPNEIKTPQDVYQHLKNQQLKNDLLLDLVKEHFLSIDGLFECIDYFISEQYLEEPIVKSYFKLSQKILLQQKEFLADAATKATDKSSEPTTDLINTEAHKKQQYWDLCELERNQREIVSNPEILASRKRLVSLFEKQEELARKKEQYLKRRELLQADGDYDPDEAGDEVNEDMIVDEEFLQLIKDIDLERADSDKISVVGSEQDEIEAVKYHREVKGEISEAIANAEDMEDVLSQYTYTYTYTYAFTNATTVPFPVTADELKKQQEHLDRLQKQKDDPHFDPTKEKTLDDVLNPNDTFEITSIFTNYSDDDQTVQKHSESTLKLMQSKIELYPNQLTYNNQRFKTKIEEIELTFKKQEEHVSDCEKNENTEKQPLTLNLFEDDDSDNENNVAGIDTSIMHGKTLKEFNPNTIFSDSAQSSTKNTSITNLESILSMFHIVKRSLTHMYQYVIVPSRIERPYRYDGEDEDGDDEEPHLGDSDEHSPEKITSGIKDLLILDVIDAFEQDKHVFDYLKSLLYQIMMAIKEQTTMKSEVSENVINGINGEDSNHMVDLSAGFDQFNAFSQLLEITKPYITTPGDEDVRADGPTENSADDILAMLSEVQEHNRAAESLKSAQHQANFSKHPIFTVLDNTEHYLFLLSSTASPTVTRITDTIMRIGELVQQQMEHAGERDSMAVLRELDDLDRKQEEERLEKEEKMLKDKCGINKKKFKLKRVQKKRKRTAEEIEKKQSDSYAPQ